MAAAATATLLSPPHHHQQQQQQPLGESDIVNRMDTTETITVVDGDAKKKRKSEANSTVGSAKKMKKRESLSGAKQQHCHQCHQARESFVECTVLTTKGKKTERCGKVFCQDCLKRRYDEDVVAITSAGRPKDLNKLLGHVQTGSYVWRCPVCSKNCNCAPHRKQYGLPPTGFITSLAKEQGLTVAQLLQDPGAMEAARLAKEATPKKGKTLASSMENSSTKAAAGKEKGAVQKVKKVKKAAAAETTAESTVKVKGAEKTKVKPTKSMADKTARPLLAIAPAPASIKPFVKQPKHVDDPEFEFIGISYPLEVIEKRLHVREFVLRFEKKMVKLPPKYFRTINDPNSEWTDLTYRNLITSLLPIIQADGNHVIHADLVYEAIYEIQKTNADSPKIWVVLRNLLEETYPGQLPEDFDDEVAKLDAIMLAIHLALQATVIRQQIDEDQEKEKDRHKAAVAEIKRLKADWEQTKAELHKERMLLKSGEKTEWDDRYAKAFNANKKLVARVEEQQWFNSRKTCLRTNPLGVDAKGNTYWMFTQRDKKDEDWGQWIVVAKNADLPHPSGTLPKFDEPSEPGDGESDPPEQEDEETAKSRIWYAVSGAENVRHLGKWITYQTDLLLYKKATAASTGTSVASAASHGTPKKNKSGAEKMIPDTPSRKLMVEVRLPQHRTKKLEPADVVTKESTEALASQLQKIANFMELNDEPQKLI